LHTGVEFQNIPAVNDGAVIVCDMSSNILTRSIDVSKFGLIYAGAQKNVGCAGVTIVIVRDDLIGKPRQECPSIIDYTVQAGINSIFNTPATWSVYMLGLVLKWVERQGGVPAMENISAMKSKMLYDLISDSNGFYTSLVEAAYRSRVNVPFRIGPPDKREQLEEQFLTEAAARGLLQLKGHRSLGGIRASMYNAMSVEEVGKLVEFMKKFMKAQQN
jgi:phosphoserine aminotransferase